MANKDYTILLKGRADFAQAQSELAKAQRSLDNVVGSVNTANLRSQAAAGALRLTTAAITATSVAAAAVMAKYIANTIEAEKVQGQLSSRLQDTAGIAGRTLQQLNAQADKIQSITVFDDEAVGNAQAMLLTFTQIRGVNFDRTMEAAADLATVMGTDIADAAKVLGKALSDPEKGLAALSKAGVTFTEGERERIKTMVEAGQIAEAQGLILDKLSQKMGTAAEAARNTLGGALQALKNAFDNVLEGDAGDAGIVGTREAIERLIDTLEDPNTKAGFDSMIGNLVRLTNFAIEAIASVGGLTTAVKDAFSANADKSRIGLLARRAALEDDLGDFQATGLGRLRRLNLAFGGRSGSAFLSEKEIQQEIANVDAALKALDKAESDARASAGVSAAFDAYRLRKDNPAPEGQGVPKPDKDKKPKKEDPDAAIKRRIESLREEATLLGQLKDGEDKASEAAKARYAITEGEFKNAPQALKEQLVAQAELLDAKREDIETEKERKKKLEETRDAYEDLREELRTPAEAALGDAIEQVNTLNAALQAGIAKQADYNDGLSRVARNLVDDQPDFGGLSPEIGGAYGELSKLEKAAEDERKWYQDSLDRLTQFRALKAENEAAADAEEERVEALHQARMRDIQAARQQAALSIASDFFGNLAQLQRSQNSKIAAVGKAAAIAQTLIETYKSATSAYAAMASIPYVGPALGVAAAAAAVAAGLANVAQIRSQPTGYAEGGYTGHGGKYEPAGIVHRGEMVINRDIVRQPGMRQFLEAINDGRAAEMYGWAGYADGGLVADRPRLTAPDYAGMQQNLAAAMGARDGNRLSLYNLFDVDALAQKLANHPALEKRIVVVASENGAAIRSEW